VHANTTIKWRKHLYAAAASWGVSDSY